MAYHIGTRITVARCSTGPMPRAAEKSDPCGLRPACRAPVARHLSQAKKGMWMGGNVPLGYDAVGAQAAADYEKKSTPITPASAVSTDT
jgi:hypothetical protein